MAGYLFQRGMDLKVLLPSHGSLSYMQAYILYASSGLGGTSKYGVAKFIATMIWFEYGDLATFFFFNAL